MPPTDPSLPDDWETADAIGSYNEAVKACGERVKAGASLPPFFLSDKAPKDS